MPKQIGAQPSLPLQTTESPQKFRQNRTRNGENRRMSRENSTSVSMGALDRAKAHSPFLRDLIQARADLVEAYLASGARSAADLALAQTDDGIDARLRKQRLGLALAVALGDLSGELSLEEVTRLLSDFADRAIDEAIRDAIAQRVPDAEAQGFAVIAMGKLGSHELNYSS